MKANRLFVAGVAALALAGCGESNSFKATLTGAAERPTAVTTSASGSVTAELANGTLTVTGSFTGLSANATAAHIHGPADKESTAGVVCPLTVPSAAAGNITGSCTFSEEQITQLRDGKFYVNIHTSTNAGGELRGQLE